MQWTRWLLLAALLSSGAAPCCAQWAPRVPPQAASAPTNATAIHLGQAAVDLTGPWRFHVGDDPRWAQPGWDDQSWKSVDLASPDGGLVPGWTTQGYPDHTGFAWYRLRVDVAGADSALELKMPDAVDDAYQVFVNGQQIGQFGDFAHARVRAYAAMPQGFRLPSRQRNGPMLIAIRVWMDSATRFLAPDAGGLRAAPVLGLEPEVAGQVRLDWDNVAHRVGSGFVETLVLLLALLVALTHFALARHDRSYLWLGLAVFVTLLANVILQAVNFTTLLPQTPAVLVRDVVLAPARIALWVVFWASWFRLDRQRAVGVLAGLLALALAVVTATQRPPLHGQILSLHAASLLTPVVLWLKLGLAGLLIVVTVLGIRRNREEGLFALPAVLLAAVASYQHELRSLHVAVTFHLWGFLVSLGQVSTILSLGLVTWMGARRFLRAQRAKVRLRLEMQQARELQRVLLPSHLPEVPGLRMTTDYRPSREVGGDFFQILPNRSDGSVIVLVGDVTGKGLRAGMLVALIMGSADALAREHPDPERLLSQLNEQLCARGYATATCLALQITANGLCTIVNAGHLPPYLNDRELEMDGALPLGTLPGVDYTLMRMQLRHGDTLTLMTDGVAEAQNRSGELFGFERVHALLATKASVREVADAAAAFGQEDDILVLRVEWRAEAARFASAAA